MTLVLEWTIEVRNNAHLMSDWKLLLLLVNHLRDYWSAKWKKHRNKQMVTLLLYEQDFLRWARRTKSCANSFWIVVSECPLQVLEIDEEEFIRSGYTFFLNYLKWAESFSTCGTVDSATAHQSSGSRTDPNYLMPIPSNLGQKQSWELSWALELIQQTKGCHCVHHNCL